MYRTITVYHNTNAEGMLRGYSKNDAVTPVFTYADDVEFYITVNHLGGVVSSVEDLKDRTPYANFMFAAFNSYPDEMHVDLKYTSLVRAYRALRLRSLSVGDVVDIGGELFAVGSTGWTKLEASATKLTPGSLLVGRNPHDNFKDG